MNLSTPVEQISRVGPQYQKKLKRLGVRTVGDLIFHFPFRYEDFSNIIPLAQAQNEIGKLVCIQGKIEKIKVVRIFKRKINITEALVSDDSGAIRVVWFNQPYLINTFKEGDFVFLAGKITERKGKKYLSAPAYEKIPPQFIENEAKFDATHTGRLIPVYPETEGMSSRWLRFIIKPILTALKNEIPDALPEKIRKENNLLPMKEAIWQIHFPDSLEKAEAAKARFIFEELFKIALAVFYAKMRLSQKKSIFIPINLEIIKDFINKLPFKITDDQRKSIWQILKDLEKNRAMNRLLNGDVGSGKTIVALAAALNTIKAGAQVTLMAPTEILTKQHFKTTINLFKGFRTNIGLITGKENYFNGKKIKREELVGKTKEGKVDILIGTHALIREKVEFKNLGLVIIDEQHRFGIEQRAKLSKKQGFLPHLLSISATPIPRTLALTLYGDLNLSLIKEMPKGRKKVITKIIMPGKRQKAYDFTRKEVKKGRQVFVICPRIEPSLTSKIPAENMSSAVFSWLEVKAVKEEYQKLSEKIFPDLKVAMLHGKMKSEEKEKILKNFKEKKINVLVSTSVIEVGIDFPNATLMLIEGADKFGLAQLHQFRGRVGRGEYQSYCLLFTDFIHNPRLKALVNCEDGFELAEKDLKIRGPGDLIGQRQWGVPDFIMASLKDIDLVEKTRKAAKEILREDFNLKKYPLLRTNLEIFEKRIHLE